MKISQFEAYRPAFVENAEHKAAKANQKRSRREISIQKLQILFCAAVLSQSQVETMRIFIFEAFHVCQAAAETIKYFIPEGDSTEQRFSL